MAQYLRPISDWSAGDGDFLNEVGDSSPLYSSIDEAAADDEDYIYNASAEGIAICYLSTGTDPGINTGHKIHWRGYSSGGTVDVNITLGYEDPIFTGSFDAIAAASPASVSDTVADYEYELTGAEAAAIRTSTDYDHLSLYFSLGAGAGKSDVMYITQAYLEVPDVPSGIPYHILRQSQLQGGFPDD